MDRADERAVIEEARATAYRLLSACFCLPEQDWLTDDFFEELRSVFDPLCPACALQVEGMAQAAELLDETSLQVEYARLFVGPDRLPSPPYGSVYLEQGRTVMGETTSRVAEFYAAEGLSVDLQTHELPDHIALELEFMYYLSFRMAGALDSGDAEETRRLGIRRREFRDDYLVRWIEPFCDGIRQASKTAFYTNLAGCLAEFVGDPEASAPLPDD